MRAARKALRGASERHGEGVPRWRGRSYLSVYEIRDPHLVEEHVMQVLKEKADFDNYKPRPFNMREFYDRTGHDIKEMLLSCYYRGMECSPEDFKVVSLEMSTVKCPLQCQLRPANSRVS
ncbi:unnamed protein product [Pleuronectes platessa]|uniref:Uncharacterized protein n=1 Tax=Pleuronectes platessa TaxID=8262 RepID=A0A9N7YTA7_PLEPL|nr:unnamed protein product [Pleuronectes platessa]